MARGELASGLRDLRSLVKSHFLDGDEGVVDAESWHYHPHSVSANPNLDLAAAKAAAVATPRDEDIGAEPNDGDEEESTTSPDIRTPPPPSPSRSAASCYNNAARPLMGEFPPPLPLAVEGHDAGENVEQSAKELEDRKDDTVDNINGECPDTPKESRPTMTLPSTPHAVVPSSVSPGLTDSAEMISPLLFPAIASNNPLPMSEMNIIDPGPYVFPFLAVIVDPRAAGPHTLAALRALYRLLERGSIIQLSGKAQTNNSNSVFVYETTLEPIARGVLACRFEQTDAGADEAVEMAIADLLRLLVEYDAAGARGAEAAIIKQAQIVKRERQLAQQRNNNSNQTEQDTSQSSSHKRRGNGPIIRIQRLPSAVLMEAFHAVYVTRQTFVREEGINATHSGGHYSPALSFHFEQVLLKMVHYLFGGEDAQSISSASSSLRASLSSRHAAAARKVLEFLVDQLLGRALGRSGSGNWNTNVDSIVELSDNQDGRALCLRLIQCCLRTGWGSDGAMSSKTAAEQFNEENKALFRLIEDNLCLALLATGQGVWSDEARTTTTTSVSLEVLSEVCSTMQLLWGIPILRCRLLSQLESIFSGFYQRALSLLRRRTIPEDAIAFQTNLVFDLEVEIVLESLIEILCLHRTENNNQSLSTLEEMFGSYDCSLTESDVASGLIVELSCCCGGKVDEDGESITFSLPSSKTGTGSQTPRSVDGESKRGPQVVPVARHRPVPNHLKELCSEALLGSLKQLFRGVDSSKQPKLKIVANKVEGGEEGSTETADGSLRRIKNRKRLLHHAAKLFNGKASKGLQFLQDNGILPNPVDPKSVSSFLRNGLVVGLDKVCVGQYLGEAGKKENPDKNTPLWECDWFHKEVLTEFCNSFGFEHQR